jgi:YtoQ family protein
MHSLGSSLHSLGTTVARSRCLGTTAARTWNVYLSGEIHSDWRDVVAAGVAHLPVVCTGPNPSHEDSDDCGAVVLGMQEQRPNWDSQSARMNLIRTRTLLGEADVVVVRFGDKFRQWNAAFEAGQATALGTPLIVVHPPGISHMLKEVNAVALAVCEEPEQVAQILDYTITGKLPAPLDGAEYEPIADRLGKGNPNP